MERTPGQIGDLSSAESYWTGIFIRRLDLLEHVAFHAPRSHGIIPHSDQMRAAVDSELAALSRIAGSQSLLHLRNSLSPICQIPPKVLCRILAWSAVLDPPTQSKVEHPKGRVLQYKLGWINATHMCQHWRDTALHEPSLWQEILIGFGPEWLRETLVRSKAGPISIHWASKDADMSCLDFMPRHLSRVQSLELDGPSSDLSAIVESLSIPSPLLEQLRLSSPSQELAPLTLPDGFLAHHAPRLRSIHLKRYLMLLPLASPPSPTFSHVVRLTMEADVKALHYSQGQRSLVPVQRLLASLQGMPALQNLRLEHCISLTTPRDTVQVICPDLQELVLHESDIGCINFLKHIEMPSLLRLHMRCYSTNLTDDCLISVGDSVSPHTAAIASHSPFHMVAIKEHLKHPKDSLVDVCTWKSNISHRRQPNRHPAAEVFIRFLHLPEMANIQLANQANVAANPGLTFCRSLPSFDEMEYITVNSWAADKGWTAQSWRDLFGRSRSIAGINVHGTLVTCSLIETLNASFSTRTANGQGSKPVFLEKLKFLAIIGAHFKPCLLHDGEEFDLFEHLVIWLDRVLDERRPPMLRIMESNITREMVEELGNFTTIHWDGKVVPADSSWIQQV